MFREITTAYGDLFRIKGVARVVTAATFSRLTTSMLSLALLLSVQEQGGSFAGSGAVMAAHAFALAVAAPISGRAADRFGRHRVLFVFIAVHAMAYALLITAVANGAPVSLTVVSAGILGASTPPASAVLRSRWPVLVGPSHLPAAYGLDAAHNSLTFVIGPLLAAGLALVFAPLAVLVGAALLKIIGDSMLAGTLPSDGDVGYHGGEKRGRLIGVLADKQLTLLLMITALDTFTIGCMQIGAGFSSTSAGIVGVLFTAMAVGEVGGGLIYGARRWGFEIRSQMAGLHFVTAVILLPMTIIGSAAMLALYLLAGFAGGARDALGQLTIGRSAAGQKVETFAWLNTFMWAGYGCGTLASGLASKLGGAPAIFTLAAVASLIAAGLAFGLRRGYDPLTVTRLTAKPV